MSRQFNSKIIAMGKIKTAPRRSEGCYGRGVLGSAHGYLDVMEGEEYGEGK